MCEKHQQLERELEAAASSIRELRAECQRVKGQRDAFETSLDAARNSGRVLEELRAVLSRLFQVPTSAGRAGAPVDEEALIARVLARIPTNGGGPIQVTPPEKLRKDFQRDETTRILAAVAGLKPLARRALKFLEGLEGSRIFQKKLAERLGRSTGGGSWIDLTSQVKELIELGLVDSDPKSGVRAATRSKIAADLALYQAADAEVEAVYQNVLAAIASEGDASA